MKPSEEVKAINRQLDELMDVAGLELAGAAWEDDRLRLRLCATAWEPDERGVARTGEVTLVADQVVEAHLDLAPAAGITEVAIDAGGHFAHGLDDPGVLVLQQPLPRPASFFMELCAVVHDESLLSPFDFLVGYLDLPHWLDHVLETPCELVRGPIPVVQAASALVAHQGCAHEIHPEAASAAPKPTLLVSVDESWLLCERVHLHGFDEVMRSLLGGDEPALVPVTAVDGGPHVH